MREIIFGISGASGAPYARRLLACLADTPDVHVHLVISPAARQILRTELSLRDVRVETLLGREADNVTVYAHRDIGARIASGSFLADSMVICPCSAHTLAAIACGLGDNLITRAAMVMLKERRRLLLVPRETPLSTIELENMARLSRDGAVILPACPGFYLRPRTIDDLVDFVVGRVLDQLHVEHALVPRWDPDAVPPAPLRDTELR